MAISKRRYKRMRAEEKLYEDLILMAATGVGGAIGAGLSYVSWGGAGINYSPVIAGGAFLRRRAKSFYRSKLRKNLESVTGSKYRVVGSAPKDARGKTGSAVGKVIGSAPIGAAPRGVSRSWLPVGNLS